MEAVYLEPFQIKSMETSTLIWIFVKKPVDILSRMMIFSDHSSMRIKKELYNIMWNRCERTENGEAIYNCKL